MTDGEAPELAETLAEVEHNERQRIARLVHDHLQQLIVAARMNIGMVLEDGAGPETLQRAADLLDEAVDASRSLAVELDPPVVLELGLGPALRWLSRWFRYTHDLDVEIVADEVDDTLSVARRRVVLQAARELLFNVVKHASVDRATVELTVSPEGVWIDVRDEGVGLDVVGRPASGGVGLSSVTQRIEAVGGTVQIDGQRGAGTRVRLFLPAGRPSATRD